MAPSSLEYLGEHLLPGQLGHLAIIIGFVSSLLAAYGLLMADLQRNDASHGKWTSIGKGAFYVHGFSILSAIGILFYLLVNKYYEYNYVFDHASDDLPMRYIFSAFWEGQEGSFLLWMFWHIILGAILLRGDGIKRTAVGILAIIQAFLSSMILGLYYNDEDKIGANPFTLVRDVFDAPIFSKADYIDLLAPMADGLNPLLQNYWMTIHPPTLFLGFAATSIPFCFAMVGLLRNEHTDWMKPALSYTLFGSAILGLGILMGGAWAYEALSFGGYWAWDPVENTSLVPWLLLVAGLHTHLIAKHTGQSIKSTYFFYALAFIMILYSTTLTRSGVLGDTSVHAFTEMGLEGQLLAFIIFFTGLTTYFLIRRWKTIPTPAKEEPVYSKEFWMFIGSLVLLFSSFLINFTTSIPVYNKLLDLVGSITGETYTEWYRSTPLDPVAHYNKFQVWIAVFIALFSGFAQFLRYRGTNWKMHKKTFLSKIGLHAALAVGLTLLVKLWIHVGAWQYLVLLWTSSFAITTNIDFLWNSVKKSKKITASALSHIGFGAMIIGVLASGLNQDIITKQRIVNDENLKEFLDEDLLDNVYLVRNTPFELGPYELTYLSDTIIQFERYYHVNIKKKNRKGEIIEEFDVRPSLVYKKGFEEFATANPSIRRYAHQDIFTLIQDLPPSHLGTKYAKEAEDSLAFDTLQIGLFENFFTANSAGQIVSLSPQVIHPTYRYQPGDVGVTAHIVFSNPGSEKTWHAYPSLLLRDELLYNYPGHINELKIRVKLEDYAFETYYMRSQLSTNADTVIMKQGESVSTPWGKLSFAGYNRKPAAERLAFQEGDIPVSIRLTLEQNEGVAELEPIYFIRDRAAFQIPDYHGPKGLVAHFQKINPQTEEVQVAIDAFDPTVSMPLLLSDQVNRDDYLVLQAKLFPGINLFWLGGLLMLFGLALAAFQRAQRKIKSAG